MSLHSRPGRSPRQAGTRELTSLDEDFECFQFQRVTAELRTHIRSRPPTVTWQAYVGHRPPIPACGTLCTTPGAWEVPARCLGGAENRGKWPTSKLFATSGSLRTPSSIPMAAVHCPHPVPPPTGPRTSGLRPIGPLRCPSRQHSLPSSSSRPMGAPCCPRSAGWRAAGRWRPRRRRSSSRRRRCSSGDN